MKKRILLAASLVVVAFAMNSCLLSLIGSAAKVTQEVNEVMEGNIFQINKATVTYSDGTLFAFKEKGKYQRTEDEYSIEIITPKKLISCDKTSRTYSVVENDMEGMYASEYVFMEETLRAEKKLDKYDSELNVTEGKKTVAGKTCVSFTSDEGTVAGWKRILMYDDNGGSEERAFKALAIEEVAADVLFEIPVGYTLAE